MAEEREFPLLHKLTLSFTSPRRVISTPSSRLVPLHISTCPLAVRSLHMLINSHPAHPFPRPPTLRAREKTSSAPPRGRTLLIWSRGLARGLALRLLASLSRSLSPLPSSPAVGKARDASARPSIPRRRYRDRRPNRCSCRLTAEARQHARRIVSVARACLSPRRVRDLGILR
jgi:hypothetical protein